MVQEKLEDQISAFLDEELPDEECQLLVRRLTRDDELRATFARYSLAGAIMRREPGIRPQPEFVSRVSDAIAGEEPHELSPAGTAISRKWLRPVAGGAIAATVAVLALISLRPTPVGEQAFVDAGEPLEDAVIVTGPAEGARPVVSPPATLVNYLVTHGDYTGSVGQLTHAVSDQGDESQTDAEGE